MFDLNKIREDILSCTSDKSIEDSVVIELCDFCDNVQIEADKQVSKMADRVHEVEDMLKQRVSATEAIEMQKFNLSSFQEKKHRKAAAEYYDALIEWLKYHNFEVKSFEYDASKYSPILTFTGKIECTFKGIDINVMPSNSGNTINVSSLLHPEFVNFSSSSTVTILVSKIMKHLKQRLNAMQP